jgi:hypothetical protein
MEVVQSTVRLLQTHHRAAQLRGVVKAPRPGVPQLQPAQEVTNYITTGSVSASPY